MSSGEKISGFLEGTPIRSLKKLLGGLISLPPNATVDAAFAVLAQRGITAVGVYDPDANKFLGFVDVLDLSVFIVQVFQEHFQKHPHLYNPKELATKFELPLHQVINASKRDVFLPVDVGESLSFLVKNFLQYSVHRVAVTEHGHIKGIVSQSDVIQFLHSHHDSLTPLMTKRMDELGLGKGQVFSVTNEEPLMKAFTTILAHNVGGIAVVDSNGHLVNNISASDLKGISKEAFFKLEVQIHEILLNSPQKLPPILCFPHSTLGEVIEQIEKTGVHRIFVVDENKRPLNVVTLTDILHVFAVPDQFC